jgi:hypothetical protein
MMFTAMRVMCATITLFGLAALANAETLTVEYEAVLDPRPLQGWPAGIVLSGRYTFESEASGTLEGPDVKAYDTRHTTTIAGVPLPSADPRIYIWDDHPISGSDLLLDRYQFRDTPIGSPTFEGDVPTF